MLSAEVALSRLRSATTRYTSTHSKQTRRKIEQYHDGEAGIAPMRACTFKRKSTPAHTFFRSGFQGAFTSCGSGSSSSSGSSTCRRGRGRMSDGRGLGRPGALHLCTGLHSLCLCHCRLHSFGHLLGLLAGLWHARRPTSATGKHVKKALAVHRNTMGWNVERNRHAGTSNTTRTTHTHRTTHPVQHTPD